MIKAIIFDLDGVILESADIKTKAFRRLFERDFPNKVDTIVKYHIDNMGISRYIKFKYIYRHILKMSLSPEKEEGLSKEFSRIALEEILHTPFVPGALEFIRARHEKYCLGIVSATPDKELQYIIEKRGLFDYFREIHGYPPGKADIIRDMLSRYQWLPQEVVFVGDAQNDREAASETGLHFVARVNLGCDSLFNSKHKIRDLNALDSVLSIIVKEKQRINIALLYTSMNNHMGGKNIHLKNLYNYLDRDNLRLFIIGCSNIEDEWIQFMLREGVKNEDLFMLPRFKKWLFIPFVLQLRKIFITKKIDIVHTFQIQSDILGGVASRLVGIKNIISQYESKIIEDNVSIIKQFFYRITNKLIKKWFKKTIVVSEGLKKELVLERFRAPGTIEVVHLGLKLPDAYKKMEFSFNNLREGRPLIGTVGRLSKEKALERLIMAVPIVLKEVPQAKFLIFGRGEERENLLGLINKLKIQSSVILDDSPWIESIYGVLEAMDIFVMPSVREGCPTALLEALALARPVVASDIEGIRDIVENEKNGFLVDTTDAKLFSEKIIYLCKHPEKAIDFGRSGRERILNNFTIESEMSKFKKIYLDILH